MQVHKRTLVRATEEDTQTPLQKISAVPIDYPVQTLNKLKPESYTSKPSK